MKNMSLDGFVCWKDLYVSDDGAYQVFFPIRSGCVSGNHSPVHEAGSIGRSESMSSKRVAKHACKQQLAS